MITAIILAAGKATRFGQSKQLVRLGDKPLLQHAIDNVNASHVDDVIVVLGAYADAIQKEIVLGRARVVMNPDFAEGMSTSIVAGLKAIADGTDAAMIVLADQPFVTPRTLDRLIDEYAEKRPAVVIPTYQGFRGNPVVVDRRIFPQMMRLTGDVGCRAIFGDHVQSTVTVAVDDSGVVSDIDTSDDLVRLGVPRVEQAIQPAHVEDRLESRSHTGGSPSPTKKKLDTDIAEVAVDLRRRRQPFAMATIVRAEAPTSSKPGDKAIISPDGTLTGWIGGSCAHDIVVRHALESLRERKPRLLTLSGSEESSRLGVIGVPMRCYSGGVLDVFIEPNLPKPHVVIFGHEAIARALVRISKALEFQVTVVDPLATIAALPEADEIVNEANLDALNLSGETFIVIATHGRFDEEAIEQAIATDASYIALVSSAKRASVMFEQLRDRGVSAAALARVKAPAGLDIGAKGSEEIALSIVAEMVKERRAVEEKKPAAPPSEVATEAIDPICQMTVEIAGARYTAQHNGRNYYFCCAHCQRTFEKEPERYVQVA